MTREEAIAAYHRFEHEHRRLGSAGPVVVSPKLYDALVRFGLIEPGPASSEPFFGSTEKR